MDLVEIRKKANSKKKKPARKTPADENVQPQETVKAEEPVRVEAIHEEPVMTDTHETVSETGADEPIVESAAEDTEQQEVKEEDPLDALFAFRQAAHLEATDNYLQALVADDDVTDINVEQWLTFSLGNEEYALTIESVSEIIKPREVTDIPRVPDFICGIISLRGIIVPIFDLNRRLHLDSTEKGSAARIIVCQDGERIAGFMVDSINQVVNVPIDNIEPPPTVLSGLDRDFVEGVGRVDNRMLILLHLSNVIDAELI